MLDAHSGKYDGELFVRPLSQGGLLYDLRRKLVVGKAVSGEDRQLLAADQCGQAVDGGNPGVDIVSGVFPLDRIRGQAVHIPPQSGGDGAQVIDGLADAVKSTSQHIRGERDLHRMPGKPGVGIFQGHIFRTLEYLDDRAVLVDLHDTPDLALLAADHKFHDLVIERTLHALQDDQRAVDTA